MKMNSEKINLARQFFFLLALFLDLNYKDVNIRFIRFHSEARECNEREFFYDTDSGGTYLSGALRVLKDILVKEYDIAKDNIYVSIASDGDTFTDDTAQAIDMIKKNIDWFNFICYIDVYLRDKEDSKFMKAFSEQFLAAYTNTGAGIIKELKDGSIDSGRYTPMRVLQDIFDKSNFIY